MADFAIESIGAGRKLPSSRRWHDGPWEARKDVIRIDRLDHDVEIADEHIANTSCRP
jgi:hypothetical protein